MKCAIDFVNWMMEPEGDGNGAPARALYGFAEDTNVPTSWTFMEREDVQDLLQQPWLVQRGIASHAEVDMLLAQYTLGLMED